MLKSLRSVSCPIGFGVGSGGLTFNDFGGANRIYLDRHPVGKWSCGFEWHQDAMKTNEVESDVRSGTHTGEGHGGTSPRRWGARRR